MILDLEDSVAPDARAAARRHVREHLQGNSAAALVRLSATSGTDLAADLAAASGPALAGVVIPKAEGPDAVTAVIQALPQVVPVVLLIETAAGVLQAPDLARLGGVSRLALGTVDLEAETGIDQSPEVLRSIRVGLTLASRAAGLPGPIDGISMDAADASSTELAARDAARTGCTGKLCIHPRQVASVNAVFSPTPEAIRWASAVVQSAALAEKGAFLLDGRMVDAPVIARAHAVLAAVQTFGG